MSGRLNDYHRCLRGFPRGHSGLPLGSGIEGIGRSDSEHAAPQQGQRVASSSAKIGGWGPSMLGCDRWRR
ncbi:unnamed protein product [Prunus armeniaca]